MVRSLMKKMSWTNKNSGTASRTLAVAQTFIANLTQRKAQGARRKAQGARRKAQGAKSKEQSARRKEQRAKCKVQSAKRKAQSAKSKVKASCTSLPREPAETSKLRQSSAR